MSRGYSKANIFTVDIGSKILALWIW